MITQQENYTETLDIFNEENCLKSFNDFFRMANTYVGVLRFCKINDQQFLIKQEQQDKYMHYLLSNYNFHL